MLNYTKQMVKDMTLGVEEKGELELLTVKMITEPLTTVQKYISVAAKPADRIGLMYDRYGTKITTADCKIHHYIGIKTR